MLRDRIFDDVGLSGVETGNDLVRSGDDLFLENPLLELALVDTEELSREDERWVLVVEEGVRSSSFDLHVTEMEKSGKKPEDVPLAFDRNSNSTQCSLSRSELGGIVNSRNGDCVGAALIEESERSSRIETERFSF